jgi:hypothetical protein
MHDPQLERHVPAGEHRDQAATVEVGCGGRDPADEADVHV